MYVLLLCIYLFIFLAMTATKITNAFRTKAVPIQIEWSKESTSFTTIYIIIIIK